MKIEIDEKSGFCFGVVKAISAAEDFLSVADSQCYCLGDIVHNRVEVSRLETLGMRSVSLDDFQSLSGATVLIRAHGEPPSTYALAERCGIRLIDATCPVVASLQKKVKAAHEAMTMVGGQVVILGKRGHAEVVGLTGQIDEDVIVVEGLDDLDVIDFSRPVYLLSQTTQPLALFEEVKKVIGERARAEFTANDTICRQVSNRNPHLAEFSQKFDIIVFVSGKKSSNGKALYGVCLEANARSYHVESPDELRAEWFDGVESVGICGATSTPRWLMELTAERIAKLRP